MEIFIAEVRDYAAACGLHPSTVVQRSGCGGGATWGRWIEGGSCSMRTADRLRQWMQDNPAPEAVGSEAAE